MNGDNEGTRGKSTGADEGVRVENEEAARAALADGTAMLGDASSEELHQSMVKLLDWQLRFVRSLDQHEARSNQQSAKKPAQSTDGDVPLTEYGSCLIAVSNQMIVLSFGDLDGSHLSTVAVRTPFAAALVNRLGLALEISEIAPDGFWSLVP